MSQFQTCVLAGCLFFMGCGDDDGLIADSGLLVDGNLEGDIARSADAAVDVGLDASTGCSDWTSGDVGEVGSIGTWQCDEGVHSLQGAGDDIWGEADSFRFTYQTLSGDGVLIAHLADFSAEALWAKAGIMMRESLDANSAHAHLLVSNGEDNPIKFDQRASTAALTTGIRGAFEGAPLFLRLQRRGAMFRAHTSMNGREWSLVGVHQLELDESLVVGLTILSQDPGVLADASFDQVTFVPGTSPECSDTLACALGVECEAGTCAAPPPPTGDYFVSPTGDDSAEGTLEAPFATLEAADAVASPGDLIYIREGIYLEPVVLSTDGTADAPVRFEGYPGERAVFRGEGRGTSPHVEQIRVNGDWVVLRGVWVENSSAAGVRVFGNHAHLDDLTIRQSGTTGINFWTNVGGIVSNSLISESYNQFGADGSPADGGNADGISFAHCTDGLITNTITWGNSDDGYDLWGSNNTRIERSFAFGNGVNRWEGAGFNGDGNGFKMGNCDSRGNASHRNIAFSNESRGFDDNCAQETTFSHCSSFDDSSGFSNRHPSNSWTNNVGFASRTALMRGDIAPGSNAWDLDIEVREADFVSIIPPELSGEESAAEALVLMREAFLRPAPDGALIDRGENLGEDSEGAGPDLGAYEAGAR